MTNNTVKTISRQLKYLVSDRYEIGIYDRNKDRMHLRNFSANEIYKSSGFLKYKNMNGHDIFIRPEGSSGYVFVDDLSITDIEKMESEGFKLALTLESSPMNYQGWLKVSDTPLLPETASVVGQYVARKFGADMRSSDWRHFGRLAGFTNRKPGYIDDIGNYPFVNIHSVSIKTYSESEDLINSALCEYEERKASLNKFDAPDSPLTDKDPADVYLALISELKDYWTEKTGRFNSSDADWKAVIKLLRLGFSKDQVSEVLLHHSESVAKRTNARAIDYINRTVLNASVHTFSN